MSNYSEQLQKIMAEAPGTPEQKQQVLFKSIESLAPAALSASERSANGEFLQILMQLLIEFLPILLKLLAG